jgi:ketosteroid isomerase-like protein
MSHENVVASRRAWDRFLADHIPGTLAFLDPEIEVHDVPGLPDARVCHGHQGWLDQIENFREAFSEMTYEPLEFIDAGDKVVGVIRATGVAKVGGLEGETTYAQLET